MNVLPQEVDLKNLSPSELEEFVRHFGKERYRSVQILRWIYQKGVHSIEEMTNLSKRFRTELGRISVISNLTPACVEEARDGTKKFLFELHDGNRVESVLIPEKARLTLCVSTQAGCALGCRFCLTGMTGFKRNLATAEILNQILAVRETLGGKTAITNIVMMGMGEPLSNYDNVLRAIALMVHPDAFKFSSRRVTLSTAGLLPEMIRLSEERVPFRLAVSLNASDDETRSRLMPVNRRYPLKQLLEVCRDFPLRRRTRITFEYVMVAGLNDSLQDAKRLVKILHGIPSKINLIPLNEAPGIPLKRPSEETVARFQQILMDAGLAAIVRRSKGADISAACGQLQAKTPVRDSDQSSMTSNQ